MGLPFVLRVIEDAFLPFFRVERGTDVSIETRHVAQKERTESEAILRIATYSGDLPG